MAEQEVTINGQNTNVKVPLDEWTRAVAREAAREVAKGYTEEHQLSCPAFQRVKMIDKNDAKLDRIQLSLAKMVGLAMGSGLFGGGTVAGLWRLLS